MLFSIPPPAQLKTLDIKQNRHEGTLESGVDKTGWPGPGDPRQHMVVRSPAFFS